MIRQLNFIFLLLLLDFDHSFSCSCGPTGTIESEIKYSDIVVTGTVNRIELITTSNRTFKKIILNIDSLHKGTKLDQDSIIIMTGVGGGDCGFYFEVGKKYIIYGLKNSNFGKADYTDTTLLSTYWTNICTRTKEFEQQEFNQITGIIRE